MFKSIFQFKFNYIKSNLMSNYNHPFHLVTPSPWPLMTSISLMNTFLSIYIWFHFYTYWPLILSMLTTLMSISQWWRDVIRESTFQGFHSQMVMKLIRYGMILFIISEIFFFISFFWTYFHSSLAPSIEMGLYWPPKGIEPFNPYNIPLLNTIILISSGLTITWSHHALLNNNFKETQSSLFWTIILGIYFSILQIYEYLEAPFSINDSIFGSIFFMATGFHGLHVIMGTLFLIICFMRHLNNHFSSTHHIGFEIASWYWHFVDIIWLFLYLSIYWWLY